MLRRVNQEKATIWIATSKPLNIQTKLFVVRKHRNNNRYSYKVLKVITHQETIRVGEYVYINLLTVSPNSGDFPKDSLLGYNLIFQNESSHLDLHDVKLLSNNKRDSIAYGNLKLPTFFIPS